MTMERSEYVVWGAVAAALACVGAAALLVGGRGAVVTPATGAGGAVASASPEALESAGHGAEKTTELLPAPAGELGAHACVERSGRAVDTAEFRGRFVVADFIFTNCGGTCPAMTAKMAELQAAVRTLPDVLLASFSVDPARDTPEALTKFAGVYGADPERWLFLRAEMDVIGRIACDDVKLWKSREDPAMHSAQFALIDRAGRVRAYYSPLYDTSWMKKLIADLETLRREPAR